MAAAHLEYRGVSVARGGQPVLHGVSLAVAPGEHVALVGASGAGKTTLLRLANAMLRADAGQVLIDGQDVAGMDPVQLRRGIGYAVQGGSLFPHWTVADNIGAVPWLLGWDRPRIAARVAQLLDMLELPRGFAARFPAELSGGQASRVGLARALAAGARLLLLDEPFGALDPDARDALGSRLDSLARDQGLTVLMVTHDLADALLRADRLAVLDGGRLVLAGPPAVIAASEAPAVQALIAAPLAQARALAQLA